MRRLFLFVLLGGCAQEDIGRREELSPLDANFFRCQVQPVLAARCSFMACHGNAERPLMLYAEQRFRLGISWDDYETPLTEAEFAANLQRVRGFVGRSSGDVDLLTEKPLDTRAGGLYHRGKDLFGNDDVFLDRQDTDFVILQDFADGAQADVDCQPSEEVRL